jgi:NTP pyrophosphatase (non-canonical NTP hydrolase)
VLRKHLPSIAKNVAEFRKRVAALAPWGCHDPRIEISALQNEVEAVSAFYAERHGITRTDDWFMLKLNEEVGELTQAYLARSGQARDKGRNALQLERDFREELSDVLSQVLLIAGRFGVDVEAEVARKWLVWKPGEVSEA